jgi:hypothetical protein
MQLSEVAPVVGWRVHIDEHAAIVHAHILQLGRVISHNGPGTVSKPIRQQFVEHGRGEKDWMAAPALMNRANDGGRTLAEGLDQRRHRPRLDQRMIHWQSNHGLGTGRSGPQPGAKRLDLFRPNTATERQSSTRSRDQPGGFRIIRIQHDDYFVAAAGREDADDTLEKGYASRIEQRFGPSHAPRRAPGQYDTDDHGRQDDS